MSPAIAGSIAAAVVVPLFLRLLGKLVPPVPVVGAAPITEDERAEMAGQYTKWMFSFVGLTVLLIYPIYLALKPLSGVLAPSGNPVFELVAMPTLWLLVAIFGAMLASALAIDFSSRRSLGDSYPKYVQFQNEKHKYDTNKVMPWTYGCLLVVVLGGLVQSASVFVHVYPDRMVLKGFFAVTQDELLFKDITRIKTAPIFIAPNGNRVQRRDFDLEFGDESWTTRWSPQELGEDEKWEIARFISEHSGVEVTELEVLE